MLLLCSSEETPHTTLQVSRRSIRYKLFLIAIPSMDKGGPLGILWGNGGWVVRAVLVEARECESLPSLIRLPRSSQIMPPRAWWELPKMTNL